MPPSSDPRGRMEIRVDACRNLQFKKSSSKDLLKKRVGEYLEAQGYALATASPSGEASKTTAELKTRVAGFLTERGAAIRASPSPEERSMDGSKEGGVKERSITVKFSMGAFSQSVSLATPSCSPEFPGCPKLEFPVDHLQHHLEISVFKSRRVRGVKKIGGVLVPLSTLIPVECKALEYANQAWQSLLFDLRLPKTAGEVHLSWTFFREETVPRVVQEWDPQSESFSQAKKAALLKKTREHRKIFGGSVEDGLECTVMANHAKVPGVLFEAMEHLRAHFLDREGLFRMSGSSEQVEKLRERAELMKPLQLEECDAHSIGGFVKKYLRELMPPVIPFTHYNHFLELADSVKDDEAVKQSFSSEDGSKKSFDEFDDPLAESTLEKFRILLASIPECNRNLLNYLMGFLETVATHAESNKMTASNLAIVFAPNLWRPEVDTPESLHKDAARCVNCCLIFIHSAPAMFWKLNKQMSEAADVSMKARRESSSHRSERESGSHSPVKPRFPPTSSPSFAPSAVLAASGLTEEAPWLAHRSRRSLSASVERHEPPPPGVPRLRSEPLESRPAEPRLSHNSRDCETVRIRTPPVRRTNSPVADSQFAIALPEAGCSGHSSSQNLSIPFEMVSRNRASSAPLSPSARAPDSRPNSGMSSPPSSPVNVGPASAPNPSFINLNDSRSSTPSTAHRKVSLRIKPVQPSETITSVLTMCSPVPAATPASSPTTTSATATPTTAVAIATPAGSPTTEEASPDMVSAPRRADTHGRRSSGRYRITRVRAASPVAHMHSTPLDTSVTFTLSSSLPETASIPSSPPSRDSSAHTTPKHHVTALWSAANSDAIPPSHPPLKSLVPSTPVFLAKTSDSQTSHSRAQSPHPSSSRPLPLTPPPYSHNLPPNPFLQSTPSQQVDNTRHTTPSDHSTHFSIQRTTPPNPFPQTPPFPSQATAPPTFPAQTPSNSHASVPPNPFPTQVLPPNPFPTLPPNPFPTQVLPPNPFPQGLPPNPFKAQTPPSSSSSSSHAASCPTVHTSSSISPPALPSVKGGPPPPPPVLPPPLPPQASASAPVVPPKRRSYNRLDRILADAKGDASSPSELKAPHKPARSRQSSLKSPRAKATQEIYTPRGSETGEVESELSSEVGEELTDSEGQTLSDDEDSEEEEPMKVDLEPAKLTRIISSTS